LSWSAAVGSDHSKSLISHLQPSTADLRRRLRVSSVLLSHASPVFRAMFGPHFNEGKVLAESSSVDVPIPDDDPIAMEAICFVLHMRSEDISSEVDADNLVCVAEHCDKYDVLVATRPAIRIWLDECLETRIDYSTAADLLNIAFKLKLWASVKSLGLVMIQEAECDISFGHLHDTHNPQIPFYIFGNSSHQPQRDGKMLTFRNQIKWRSTGCRRCARHTLRWTKMWTSICDLIFHPGNAAAIAKVRMYSSCIC
jgi:hypothetical protein